MQEFKLRQYQEHAVREMIRQPFRYLAYEMGLGKTLMVLEYLFRTKQKAFIVAPLLVAQRVWPQETKKFGYPFKVAVLHGAGKEDMFRLPDIDLKVINYDGLKWLEEQIEKRGSHDLSQRVLILDEATCIKSGSTQRFKILQRAQHLFRKGVFCLSGTPMPKGYEDLWSQYWMLDRGRALEPTNSKFIKKYFWQSGPPRYQTYLQPGSAETIQQLIKPLTSIMRAGDYIEMPEFTHTTWRVRLPEKVYDEYAELAEEALTSDGEVSPTAGVVTNKLRQLTQGALYHEVGDHLYEIKHIEKITALLEILDLADGAPILCPIYFRFEADMIQKALAKKYGTIPLIAGGMTQVEKQKILDQWDKRTIPLLLVQPSSLTHGVNMQYGGNWIVWYGLPWSLEQYQQLNGRLIRPGQKEPVKIIHIMALGTKDHRVFEKLEQKDITQEQFMEAMNDREEFKESI